MSTSRTAFALVLALNLAGVWGSPTAAGELPSFETAAKTLMDATVTVRISMPAETAEAGAPGENAGQPADATRGGATRGKVTVCSGIAVGERLIVTSAFAGTDSRVRITFPGGTQSTAQVRLIDEHSGLLLLEVAERKLSPLALSDAAPKIGAWVISAAGWGAEKPVVSLGLVSGTERKLPGVSYPPLLQCDLKTASTSSGAAIVNGEAQLMGVVIATDPQQPGSSWTYAVPAPHVQRLLRSYNQHFLEGVEAAPEEGTMVQETAGGTQILVLKRRRPSAGMVLTARADQIVVQRLEAAGPAARAGLEVGDEILACDGVQVRSVYQVVRPILYKQPGDVLRLRVQQNDRVRELELVLGGGVPLPASSLRQLGKLIQPKVDMESVDGAIVTRKPEAVRQFVDAGGETRNSDEGATDATPADKIQLLQRALDSYRAVIEAQQAEIRRNQQQRKQAEEQLSNLQREVDRLKKRVK